MIFVIILQSETADLLQFSDQNLKIQKQTSQRTN